MSIFILISRILSSVFRPIYYPTLGFVVMLCCTYLSFLPWGYHVWVLSMVILFTVLLPMAGIEFYRKFQGWKTIQLREREKRMIPYVITLCCYLLQIYFMHKFSMPRIMSGIIVASIFIQCACILMNMYWKVSLHAAGSGGVIGAIAAYSVLFNFNPVWWLCVSVLVSGLVMTSRMLLRQHTLAQVLVGTLVGIFLGYLGIMCV